MNQFLQFAEKVLENEASPLIYQDIWKKGVELNLDKQLKTKGKTPWQTIGAQLKAQNAKTRGGGVLPEGLDQGIEGC